MSKRLNVKPRAVIDGLPQYKPGKSAAQVSNEEKPGTAAAAAGTAAAAQLPIIKLASNETSYTPLPSVQAAIAQAASDINRYPDNRCEQLRQALADKLGVANAAVTVGCGSVGLMRQLFLAYVDPGDQVLYPWRSFEIHPVFSAVAQAEVVTVPLVDEAFDLAALAKAVTGRTKMVLLSTPNNPTGTACTTTQLQEFLGAVPDDVLVIIDEAYREFVTDPAVEDPITQILPHHPNALVLRTFSKAYGLASLRVGYAVGDEEVIATLDKVYAPFLVSGVAQAAAVASLRPAAEVELAQRVDEVVAQREVVMAALVDAGWPATPSQANFIWLRLGEVAFPTFARLEQAGILTRPFEGEGLRVTIGSPAENERLLAVLGRADN